MILEHHGITEGVLVLDESDQARSKHTKRLHKVNGQTVVLLLLMTESVTFTVGYAFYMPDPVLTKCVKEDKRLRLQGIAKKDRPAKPERDSLYPTKTQIALRLLQEFRDAHGEIKVKSVLADALYGTDGFMSAASKLLDNTQIISHKLWGKAMPVKPKGQLLQLCKHIDLQQFEFTTPDCIKTT